MNLTGLLALFLTTTVPVQSFPYGPNYRLPGPHSRASGGPKYPVTGAWFRDRYSYDEWNRTLALFQQQGGDTVLLRAPPLRNRSREDILNDPEFQWCHSNNSSTGTSGLHCVDEALRDMTSLGLDVTALMTYQYDEGFSDVIMKCPAVDRKINSSRIYYRIVLPADKFDPDNPCAFTKGAKVVVVLTSYGGLDPHSVLLTAADHRDISVYFGLPGAPRVGSPVDGDLNLGLLEPYYAWVHRVLTEHQARYSKVIVGSRSGEGRVRSRSLYNKTLTGYFINDEACLAQIDTKSPLLSLYSTLGQAVRGVGGGKKVGVSVSLDLTTLTPNTTVQRHVTGYDVIASTGQVDVIAVQEGRGRAKAAYYWPTQLHSPIHVSDVTLDKALHSLHPQLPVNVTFQQVFSGSVQEMFGALEQHHDGLEGRGQVPGDLWLTLEAFESLRDDPCLPVDPRGSGNPEIMNRASKQRLDRGLTAASVRVQKVVSFAWDPDFTCTTTRYKASLTNQIRATGDNQLIANCSFHSSANKSIVLVGYNLGGPFEINWPARGKREVSKSYGYYFEMDWGIQHNRVPSLMYTQLYPNLPDVWRDLDDSGWVSVRVEGSANQCVFQFDFTRSYGRHYKRASASRVYRR